MGSRFRLVAVGRCGRVVRLQRLEAVDRNAHSDRLLRLKPGVGRYPGWGVASGLLFRNLEEVIHAIPNMTSHWIALGIPGNNCATGQLGFPCIQ